ncbi:MAG: prepilin-type N-terminal cleavage/methylation domain-containing protein [Candidatus Zixiibacteriota bacterium]
MKSHKEKCIDRLGQAGFTLIELVIVIVAMGILAAFAIPKFADMTTSSKITATKDEMILLKKSIIGNPAAVAGGEYVDRGFEGDIGYPPSRLQDLAVRPESIPAYNKLTRIGWNGPYIDSSGSQYLKDAWGTVYQYSSATRTLKSTGGGADSVVITF